MHKYRFFWIFLCWFCAIPLGCAKDQKAASPQSYIHDITQAEWSPGDSYFALVDSGRRLIVKEAKGSVEWQRTTEDIWTDSRQYADGRPSHIILWPPKQDRVALVYLRKSKPAIRVEIFKAQDGQQLFAMDIAIPLVNTDDKERTDFILGAWNPNRPQIAISYSRDVWVDPTLYVIDLEKKQVTRKFDDIIDYKWLDERLVIFSKYNGKPGGVFLVDEKGQQVSVPIDKRYGTMNNIAVTGQHLYTIQLRGLKGKIHLHFSSFEFEKKRFTLEWSATAITGPGKDANSVGLIDLLPSPKGDYVAVAIAYATDFSSGRKVWCFSKKEIVPPNKTSENIDTISEVDPLLWQSDTLLLSEFTQISLEDYEVRYVKLSLPEKRLSVVKIEKWTGLDSWTSHDFRMDAQVQPVPGKEGKFQLVFKDLL